MIFFRFVLQRGERIFPVGVHSGRSYANGGWYSGPPSADNLKPDQKTENGIENPNFQRAQTTRHRYHYKRHCN